MAVAQSERAIVVRSAFVVVRIWVVGNLEEILTILPIDAELIVRRDIANDRREGAAGVRGVVQNLGNGRGEAVVGARAGGARIPGCFRGVVTEGELGFAGVEISGG